MAESRLALPLGGGVDVSDVERSVTQVGATPLSNWVVSDISLQALEQHSGPALRQLGAQIMTLNSFELYDVSVVQEKPTLLIHACVWPPEDCWPYLELLVQRYTGIKPSHEEKCRWYEVFIYEAIIGQVPKGTVVSINRQGDNLKGCITPSLLAMLGHVPGYVPRQCRVGEDGELIALCGAQNLVARVSTTGPLDPQTFVGSRGYFDLVDMCGAAKAQDMRVIFLGEHDGSLAMGIATGLLYYVHIPRQIKEWSPPDRAPLKVLGGYVGQYIDFHEHARDHRVRELLNAYLSNNGSPALWSAPVRANMQPHTNLNAAIMWYYARVVAQGGTARSYIASPSSTGV